MEHEFTVASTTDSQEAVDHAAGIKPAEPVVEVPAVAQSAESEALADEVPPGEKPVVEVKPEVPKNGYEKRINKLTAKNYSLENENAVLKERLDAIEERLNKSAEKPKEEAAPATAEKEPLPGDFGTYEEYVKAAVSFGAKAVAKELFENQKQAEAAKQQETAKATQQAELQATFDSYSKQVSEIRGRVDDFDEVVGASTAQFPQAAQFAIMEQDNGADIVYHLAKNPEICEELNKLINKPLAVAARIGKLSVQLAKADGVAQVETPATPTTPKRPVSKAPAPVTPVAGSGTKAEIPLGDLSYEDYKAQRQRGKRS